MIFPIAAEHVITNARESAQKAKRIIVGLQVNPAVVESILFVFFQFSSAAGSCFVIPIVTLEAPPVHTCIESQIRVPADVKIPSKIRDDSVYVGIPVIFRLAATPVRITAGRIVHQPQPDFQRHIITNVPIQVNGRFIRISVTTIIFCRGKG